MLYNIKGDQELQMTKDDKQICHFIKNNVELLNNPTEQNNICIDGNTISLKINGEIVKNRILDVKQLKECSKSIIYPSKNPYTGKGYLYSPIESDRSNRNYNEKHNGLNFPKFVSIILVYLLELGRFPSVTEFAKNYLDTYLELIPDDEINDDRKLFYKNPKAKDRETVGQKYKYPDGTFFINKVYRIKDEYLEYTNNLPFNEFTTHQIYGRIHKAFGSICRDVMLILGADALGDDAHYSLHDDIMYGIDGVINGYIYCGYSDTKAGRKFREEKIWVRHRDIKYGHIIEIAFKGEKDKDGLQLIRDEIIESVCLCTRYGYIKSNIRIEDDVNKSKDTAEC